MKTRAEKRKEKKAMFGRLEAAARFKFETFDRLNKDIDAKVTADMTQAEKQKLSRQRVVSQRMKAQIVAKQTHVLVDEVGAGSCNGMHFKDGNRTNQVRGKVKIKQKGIVPRSIKLKGEK